MCREWKIELGEIEKQIELDKIGLEDQESEIQRFIKQFDFQETIYCVSEAPVSQLRFVCVDCYQKNITDMVNVLSGAQDLTRSAGFPVYFPVLWFA